MRKRLLGAFLVLCVVATLLPPTVLAAPENTMPEYGETYRDESRIFSDWDSIEAENWLEALPNSDADNDMAELMATSHKGTCGENVTWTLSNGVLTISGTGAMRDYAFESFNQVLPAWYKYRDSIIRVVIENGVTTIGDLSFVGCKNLTNVIIPNSIITVGDRSFTGCSSLTSVTIPGSVTSIRKTAFFGCTNLTGITIPSSVTFIGDMAFYNCTNLTAITVNQGNIAYCDMNGILFTSDCKKLVQFPGGKKSNRMQYQTVSRILQKAHFLTALVY